MMIVIRISMTTLSGRPKKTVAKILLPWRKWYFDYAFNQDMQVLLSWYINYDDRRNIHQWGIFHFHKLLRLIRDQECKGSECTPRPSTSILTSATTPTQPTPFRCSSVSWSVSGHIMMLWCLSRPGTRRILTPMVSMESSVAVLFILSVNKVFFHIISRIAQNAKHWFSLFFFFNSDHLFWSTTLYFTFIVYLML